jgi:hypothetical protein
MEKMNRFEEIIVKDFTHEDLIEFKKEIGEPMEYIDELDYGVLEENGWEILEQLTAEYLVYKKWSK